MFVILHGKNGLTMNFDKRLEERILILDGAMGTKIQSMGLTADHYHRGRFAGWPVSLTGNNDVLCMTAPDIIADIHRLYIKAGADIITTNTFSANRISQREYGCEEVAREMALAGARIARQVADEAQNYSLTSHPSPLTSKKILVAGSMGPTSKSLTLASDMNDPSQRSVDFDEMAAAYGEQAEALLEGGADMLLLETCFDALNAKAALYAIQLLNERLHREIPVMVSATINDRSGRTLTGQTLEAFYVSISHYPYLLSFGLNCSFGVTELRPFVEQLSARIPVYLSLYPNAGLPNEMGEYDELPEFTASHLRQMAEAGLLNIAGGCCGTDEHHIRAISQALKDIKPRKLPTRNKSLCLSGLETIYSPPSQGGTGGGSAESFTNIGERTNVAGSRKFARLIAEKKYDEALTVARHQIEGGATIIDINMDDAMLDSRQEMQTFCRYIAGDPAVSRAVLMIDSSDWPTVIAGLKNAQGKCIVNSISLKGGEEDFLNKARELRRLGAAVVVMAFDEEGQATTYERKIAIAQRAYDLLTGGSRGFVIPAQDIIFDVNILSVATGIAEHQTYGIDFIRAVEWIKQHLPLAKTSGGVSNLSFAFRGNNRVREAMHSVFLYHAIHAGLDMAIVNPAMLQVYDDIEPHLLKAVEDVILNTDDGATERLVGHASQHDNVVDHASQRGNQILQRSETVPTTVEERLKRTLSRGDTEHLAEDIAEALQKYGRPIDVIEQPLMQAMAHIGQLFGEGKMFLPQVVKSAKVMKEAVALLQPYIDAEQEANNSESIHPCVVLATANGDVHDIGKNIVGIVLGCNGFEVIDLGVMVPAETILKATKQHNPCLVGISGLITPSLKEMELLCQLFQREGLRVPIVVGGATTSAVHTAVKLAPLYDGCVVYGGDASQTSLLAKQLQLTPDTTIAQIRADQEQLRSAYEEHHAPLTPYDEANRRAPHFSLPTNLPTAEKLNAQLLPSLEGEGWPKAGVGSVTFQQIPDIPLSAVAHLIDWRMFLLFWGFKGETLQQLLVNPEAERTLAEGKRFLQTAIDENLLQLQALLHFEPATRRGNDIVLADGTVLPMLRSQSPTGHYLCLSDFFDEQQPSPLGLFTVSSRQHFQALQQSPDDLMTHALCARLAEACAEWLQSSIFNLQSSIFNLQSSILRVAFGYATCPDHSLKRIVFDRLQAEERLGITLTDHYSIQPSTSVCGLFICHPEARYFPVGRIDRDQLADYCRRRGITLDEGETLLSKYISH
jgi:5-methyltetrahydrofolate--homocysteine methyltransferase